MELSLAGGANGAPGDPLYDLLVSCDFETADVRGMTSHANFFQPMVPVAEAPPMPDMDMDDLLDLYPLNSTDLGPSAADSPPVRPKRKLLASDAEGGCSPVQQEAASLAHLPPGPKKITGMSLAAKTFAMKCMLYDIPSDIHPEAESRLMRVRANPHVLLMHRKSAWGFVEDVVQMRKQFYIGITERPSERLEDHLKSGFQHMALWMYEDSGSSASNERQLIRACWENPFMLNIGKGGERRSAARPHFLYVVVRK